jgi:DNA (cytosine-5)-methyltransferase 1
MSLKHGSLFSGIGGFDLAAEWIGWENIFQCEIDGFCNKVLEKNFPNTKKYKDIKQFNGYEYRNKLDVLTGGFPCQPFSTAGKQKGTKDNRSLWGEMFRIIKESRPTYIVGENVNGIVKMELDNIWADLESEGYTVETFNLPACAVSAAHIRKRIWITAYLDGRGRDTQSRIRTKPQKRNSSNDVNSSNATFRRKKTWMAEPKVERVVYGIPRGMDKNRVKALGNAIVPQIAYEIFNAIQMAAIADKERGQNKIWD